MAGPDKIHAAQAGTLDSYISALLQQLERQGLADDTIVVFTSDNGPHEEGGINPDFFNANGRYRNYKRNLYEGGIRVPFHVWAPKVLARTAGKTTSHTAVHYDLFLTLLDLAGAPVPAGLDGLSLRKVFTGRGGAPEHRYLYWVRTFYGRSPRQAKEDHGRGRRVAAAVRFGRWKFVGFGPGQTYSTPGPKWEFELYDLKADPGERRDLAKKKPRILKQGVKHMRGSWRVPLEV